MGFCISWDSRIHTWTNVANYKITDSLKHVGLDESRPVMPGITFVLPRDETRLDPTDNLPNSDGMSSSDLPPFMVKRLRGLSAVTASEIADIAEKENLPLGKACERLLERPLAPVTYYRDGKPFAPAGEGRGQGVKI